MAQRVLWESIKVQGAEVVDQVKRLIREGNVRRVVVKQREKTVAEFPLTVGIVGALAAPVLAAIGALAAVLTDCTIVVERRSGAKPAAERKRRKSKA
jgi:DNA-binding Lrp family transcriptional regulator